MSNSRNPDNTDSSDQESPDQSILDQFTDMTGSDTKQEDPGSTQSTGNIEDASNKTQSDSDDENSDESNELDFDVPHPLMQEFLQSSIEDNVFTYHTADGSYSATLRQYGEYLEEKGIGVFDASTPNIYRFLSSKTDENRQATLHKKRSAIKGFYKFVLSHHDEIDCEINYFALDDLDLPDSKLETINRSPLTESEVRLLLEELDCHRDRLMVLLGVLTGPRNEAIRKLEIDNLAIEEESILLKDLKNYEEYEIPLDEKLIEYIEYYLQNVRPTYPGADEYPYLFLCKHGGGLIEDAHTLSNLIRDAAEDAGIQEKLGEIDVTKKQKEDANIKSDKRTFWKVTTHTLRHTFNDLMAERGVPREIRSHLLNHSNTDTTKKYYDDDRDIEEFKQFLDDISDFL